MATWILQGNPDQYVIDGYVREVPEPWWQIRQHAGAVQAGDDVYIWRAAGKHGLTSGIIARGAIKSAPIMTSAPPDDPFRLGPPEGPSLHAPLTEVRALSPGDVLSRDTIRAAQDLAGLRILVQPNATVFAVTPEEAEALAARWDALPSFATPAEVGASTLMEARQRAFRSPAFWLSLDTSLRDRRTSLHAMREVITAFLTGATSLEDLRSTWDHRTRARPWSAFGLGGLNHGMVLNKLCKHLGTDAELTDRLRAVLAAGTPDETLARLSAFQAWVEAAIQRGVAARSDLQPARIPAMVSGFWHVQDPDAWPVLYPSVRDLLFASAAEDPSYGDFREAALQARDELGLSTWALDRVAAHASDDGAPVKVDAPESFSASSARRVWLIGAGPQSLHRDRFLADQLVAIGGVPTDLREFASKEDLHTAMAALPFTSDNPRNDTRACWDFLHAMRPGDEVLLKHKRSVLIARGVVRSDYRFDPQEPYQHLRDVAWSWRGEAPLSGDLLPTKTLTPVLPPFHQKLLAAIDAVRSPADQEPTPQPPAERPPYRLEDAAADLFLDEAELQTLLLRLQRKKNLILHGPPGTGKTFVAGRLARLIVGADDDTTIRRVQFHPGTTYEHFVEGYRPAKSGGFELVRGPFRTLCAAADDDPETPHVLIIDEINRGNLAKVFGELLSLIEENKRKPQWSVRLHYSDDDFYVPDNVYLIGTMNTADRSLALVDHALRRRFGFAPLRPAFALPRFQAFLADRLGDAVFAGEITRRFRKLNERIEADAGLGAGFMVGHAFFCDPVDDPQSWYAEILDGEIEPLLEEYWFDQRGALESAIELLRGAS